MRSRAAQEMRFQQERPGGGGARETGRRHKGRVNQPNNHSKLTDSNNCTVLVLVWTLLLLLRRPSSLCLLPVTLRMSSIGDSGLHVKRVAERRATHLRDTSFPSWKGRRRS